MSSELAEDISELQQLRIRYDRLQEDYQRILPKVVTQILLTTCFRTYMKIQILNQCIYS